MTIDGEHIDEPPSVEQPEKRYDFSVVQGFQVAADHDHPVRNAGEPEEAWRGALRLELEARAARLHQAVDASIVLASDGVIRWLGDPVARLAPGPNLLTPRAVILADESLPPEAQQIVSARIELWLMATIRRLLGPLFALEALQDGSEAVRGLAAKIAQSLGIMEREPIRAQIKALDQGSRAALRKQGVRFGAYYIYVPAVLKPAARNLALHLRGVQTPNVDADALARALGPLAASGRTSLPVDGSISRDSYRIAGFRPCGDQIVRVDIVERLADMIRAAFVQRSIVKTFGDTSYGTSSGFVVSGQMTSLTGCSGVQFASILRSMGFESVEVKRSEFFAPAPAPTSSSTGALNDPAAVLEPELPESAVPSTMGGESTAAVSVPAAVKQQASPADSHEDEAKPPMAPASHPRADETERKLLRADSAASAVLATSEARGENAETDAIVVWRPAQRPESRRGRHVRHQKNEKSKKAARERNDSPNLNHASDRKLNHASDRERPRIDTSASLAPDAGGAGAHAHPGGERQEASPVAEKRPQRGESDRQRHHRNSEEKTTKVDPNSPFAKLLELRHLLEGQAKKRT